MCTDERVSSHLLSSMRLVLRLAACRPRLDGTGQSEPPDQLPKVVEATGASYSSSNGAAANRGADRLVPPLADVHTGRAADRA